MINLSKSFLLFVLFIAGPAVAIESVTILKMSKSKKTIILSVGASQGFHANDRARLSFFEGVQRIPVAELTASKSAPTHSYWMVERVNEEMELRPRQIYLLELLGDREEVQHQITVASSEDLQDENAQGEGTPIFKDEGFSEEETTSKALSAASETVVKAREDIPFVDEQKYMDEYSANLPALRPDFSKQTVDMEKVKKSLRDERFEHIAKQRLFRYRKDEDSFNTENYLYSNLSSEFEEEQGITDLPDLAQLGPLDAQTNAIDQTAMEKINEEGDLWSKGMSAEEIRAYMIRTGLAKEKEFREKALHELYSHELALQFTTSPQLDVTGILSDHPIKGHSSSFQFGYEYLLARTSPYLKNFTVEGLYKTGSDILDLSGTSLTINRASVGGNLKFYFYNKPYSVKKYMLFAGFGLTQGSGTVQGEFLEMPTPLEHTLFSSSFSMGLKYRFIGAKMTDFFKGWGLSCVYTRQNSEYLVYNDITGEFFNVVLGTQAHYFSLGLSLYF